MKAYKGFAQDMTCNPTGTKPFQFVEGETFEEPSAVVCKRGFHAVTMPLDVLSYYPPNTSVYHEVEVDDDAKTHPSDSKVASRRIQIGARLTIAGLVKAQFAAVWEKCTVEPGSAATGDQGAASATGDQGAASATGYRGAASATGDQGAASATGYQGAASATGKYTVALAAGFESRAQGAGGCVLSLVERADYNDEYRILAAKSVIVGQKANGIRVKPDAWYSLRGGKVVEVNADGSVVKR